MSRSVSRFTLNGMFLITMAVGIMSSSAPRAPGVVGPRLGVTTLPIGGEPPDDEKSELLLGDNERLSEMPTWALSSHC